MTTFHIRVLFFVFALAQSAVHAQVVLTESNLPIVTINTGGKVIPDEPKIIVDMRISYNASGLTKPTDSANVYFGKAAIETRGSTSQSLSAKKPYGIDFKDASGNEREVALFKGWTKIDDYILSAPYTDKSLIREVLTYHLAGKIMPYAPKTQFCELILNGEYQGVYHFTESIKRKRLGIAKADSLATSGDALTGGYIVKIDKTTGEPGGITTGFNSQITGSNGKRTYYLFDYPKPEDIKPAQANYIKSLVREFESVMNSDKFSDDTEGYAKYFDVSTLVDYCIMNELTNNVDGYRLSTYFFKDKNSINPKFKMGPVWDYNITMGNANYCSGGEPDVWAYQFNGRCPADGWGVPFWFEKLFSDNKFKRKFKERWEFLRKNQLSTPTIMGTIDSLTTLLASAQQRNFRKWNILNTHVWPNRRVNGSYSGEIFYLKDWLTQRLAWLDGQVKALKLSEHPKDELSLEVFPNPSSPSNDVRFAYYLAFESKVQLKIYNSVGQLVFSRDLSQAPGDNNVYWQENYQKGVFIYEMIINGTKWKTGKLVKY